MFRYRNRRYSILLNLMMGRVLDLVMTQVQSRSC
jgi:hypothetical protein